MSQIHLGADPVNTGGNLPAIGTKAPGFVLTGNDLKNVSLESFLGKNVILNIFPSIDTRTCAMSVREFNRRAASLTDTVVLCIAKDLPFAMRRFCGAEGIDKVMTLSDFRSTDFMRNYGVEMIDGAMAGLMARAIVAINKRGLVIYTELVPVIGQEPDYDSALEALA